MIVPNVTNDVNPADHSARMQSNPPSKRKIEVTALRLINQPGLRALCSVRMGGLLVHGVMLRYRRGRLCVVLPFWRDQGVEAVSPALKAALNDAVIEAWKVASAFRGATDV
jgi:hypothetical protein